jgi:hypothetical protein
MRFDITIIRKSHMNVHSYFKKLNSIFYKVSLRAKLSLKLLLCFL